MEITERFIKKNAFSRPGLTRVETLGIVVHWIGNAGTSADANARYFEILGDQSKADNEPDRYASAHAIVGMDGEIIQVMPWDEVAYHVGAMSYTAFAGNRFPRYVTNQHMGTPNWCTIGIELCHPDWSGQFTRETLRSAKKLAWWLLRMNELDWMDIYQHYQITGKRCPKWFVEHPDDWRDWLQDIQAMAQLEE